MGTFTVVIKTDNVAYEDGNFYDEIIANLKTVSNQLNVHLQKGFIRDSNGNRVGKFYYESGE